jgi:hypothetical protein
VGAQRFLYESAVNESSIVMTRAAQLQLDPQARTVPPILREEPTAAGVEEVPLMHQNPINTEAHCISPPAEHQSLTG